MSPPTESIGGSSIRPSAALSSRAAPFGYRAFRADGTTEFGELAAECREQVAARLTARGLFPVEIEPQPVNGAASRIRTDDLARGMRVMASILAAGVPMERSLAVFAHVAPSGWPSAAIDALRSATREGRGFASALGATALTIPDFVLGIIEAGDANGTLAASLLRAAEEMETSASTSSAIRGALAYPLLLAVSGLLSVMVLVGIVLPRFAVIISDLGQRPPLSARVVLALTAFGKLAFIPGLVTLSAGVVLWRRWLATDLRAPVVWATSLLRLPVTGGLWFATSGARVTSTLGAMLASGVPITTAMQQAARASGNAAVRERLLIARERVLSGERLSSALAHTAAIPAGAIQLVRAGEATGELASMLTYAARIDRERSEAEVKRLVRLIEPSLILFFGALIALVAAALLQAVYSVRPTA